MAQEHKLMPFVALGILLAVLFSCHMFAPTAHAFSINYWVSPSGSDQASGEADNPFRTIAHARDVVRASSFRGEATIYVHLKGGMYRLSQPLTLTAADSGASGAEVVYQAASGETAVISGAQAVTGWTLHDADLNIWRASVSTSLMPRQVYVNGQRAVRARTADYPNYYYPDEYGYYYEYIIGDDPQLPPTWSNPSLVEAVTATQWKMMRCPVAEVIGSQVVMQSPCWQNSNVFPFPWSFYLLNWWENAYEFLDQPGEWYLNPTTQALYYIPLAGQDMSTASVELPVLEKLIDAAGDASQPVSHIRFKGLSFQHATWLGPNGPNGYALDQSGFHLTGSGHAKNEIGHDPNTVGIPGNLSFEYAHSITFEGNAFAHLGGVALRFGTGSQDNAITGNTFNDISAAAIQVGGIARQDHHPEVPAQLTRDNRVANNLVEYTGQDYHDCPGIYIGFTTRSLVEHNEIRHVPWAGIAIGWGWGLLDPGGFPGLPHATPYQWGHYDTPTAARGNQIIHNKIEYFLEKLWDGGAIYCNGFQGTSLADGQLIAWNVAQHKRPEAGGNTFYTDGGSRYITVRENVSLDNPQGYIDFGPCDKASSFPELCLVTDLFPYGADLGGCVPYGDMLFENNYLRDNVTFYDICSNDYYPDAPFNMTFINNVKVSSSDEVPSWILESAGIVSEGSWPGPGE